MFVAVEHDDELMRWRSGRAYDHRSESCDEVLIEGYDQCDENEDQSPTRGRVHEASKAPTHHQAVSLSAIFPLCPS